MEATVPAWLRWAREIQALSQTGLAYCEGSYERERYERLLQIAAEIVASHSALSADKVLDDFHLQLGYATPKVGVRGAVVRHDKILLVQEKSDGLWCLPGGWADVGEAPSAMVVREVFEESGFHVTPRKLIAVYDGNRTPRRPSHFYHLYRLVFLCDIAGGAPAVSDETLAVDFFDFDRLPPLSTNRTDERQLREVQAHLLDPARATAFD
jgi:ADP-ribose pyrophosphatase YjhB (NUDIX family)